MKSPILLPHSLLPLLIFSQYHHQGKARRKNGDGDPRDSPPRALLTMGADTHPTRRGIRGGGCTVPLARAIDKVALKPPEDEP